MRRLIFTLTFLLIVSATQLSVAANLRVGATIVDVTPTKLPVLVNGGMLSRSADSVKTRLNARAIVVEAGEGRVALVVVDSCMLPRVLLDDVKQMAADKTKLTSDSIMISATHTHSAPSSMSCLGTEVDPDYVFFLREKLVQAIIEAESHLEPARVGWGVGNAAEFTALRRWILRPDKIGNDPFGNPTVRATMHAGANWDIVTGESGPEDPDLSMIAFQSIEGRPIAALANFSMHYFSVPALSADYFGLFCDGFQNSVQPKNDEAQPANDEKTVETKPAHPPCVAIMSHGCSGDIWRRDYKVPAAERNDGIKVEEYTDGLLKIALDTYKGIEYQSATVVKSMESRVPLKYRVPSPILLEWSRNIADEMGDRPPKTTQEVYAREQIILHEKQSTEVVIQAIQIGDIGIATFPTETYALTGLKIKHQSPLTKMMVIELANGGDGYIPPPEQHLFGGYNTWAARSAGLEVQAEPILVERNLQMLEQITASPRRVHKQSQGPLAQATLALKPIAYYRLDEFSGSLAKDSTGNENNAQLESHVAYFLDGPTSKQFGTDGETNRSVHFVGSRLKSHLSKLGDTYSVSLWFWNGIPFDARNVAGWMFSRGRDNGLSANGEHLGLGGTTHSAKLIYFSGNSPEANNLIAGSTEIKRWAWNQITLVRDGKQVRVYLNGNSKPEIETTTSTSPDATLADLFFAGRSDNDSNWEGRLDEIAVFDRALTAEEVRQLAP